MTMRLVFDYALVVLMFAAFVWAFMIEFRVFMVQTKRGSIKEAHRARYVIERLKTIVPRDHRKQGFSRIFAAFLSGTMVASMFWGATAYWNHQRIKALQAEITRRETVPPNVITMHGLKVIARTTECCFDALVWNPVTREWGKFHANVCPGPLPMTTEIQAGVTLREFQYIEDREHHCMDLSTKYAGYSLERNSDGTAIIDVAANARQATTP